jgi:p-cumate 2,3-dioxygenase subunit alpha
VVDITQIVNDDRDSGRFDGDAYSPTSDRGQLGLLQPRTNSCRGFVFINLNGRAMPFTDYLKDARYLLGLLADQSGAGMRTENGQHHYSMDANWKLVMENGIDGQPGMTVHQTYFKMIGNLGSLIALMSDWRVLSTGIKLGRRHSMTLSSELDSPLRELLGAPRPSAHPSRARPATRRASHTHQMLDTTRNVNVLPDLLLIDIQFVIQIRTRWPAPGRTDKTGLQLIPSDTDEVHGYRMTNEMAFWGSAGLARPDDIKALEQCQRGFPERQP